MKLYDFGQALNPRWVRIFLAERCLKVSPVCGAGARRVQRGHATKPPFDFGGHRRAAPGSSGQP